MILAARISEPLGYVLAVAIAIAAFGLCADFSVLNPTDFRWLLGTHLDEFDRSSHFLGWLHFSKDVWRFPLGANPNNGLEIGNSLVYSDSIPLLAIPMKLIAQVTGASFQYFGIWMFLCFVLQAMAAFRLSALASNNTPFRLLAVSIFCLTPILAERLSRHMSLGAHFFVILALLLVLDRGIKRRSLMWICLIAAATLVHFYILAMVGALWVADLMIRIQKAERIVRLAIEFSIAIFAVLLCAWQAGYFVIGSGAHAPGYGHYSLDILGPVIPMGFSSIIPEVISFDGAAKEGFAYFGLGQVFIVSMATILVLSGRLSYRSASRKFWPLLGVCVCLWIFAISNYIHFASHELKIPLPLEFVGLANFLRSSGRMFWPVAYLILFASIWCVARGVSTKNAIAAISMALVLQVVDIAPGLQSLRQSYRPSTDFVRLESQHPFWRSAISRSYDKLRFLPTGNMSEGWMLVSDFGARHAIPTDGVYLARIDQARFKKLRAKTDMQIESGVFEADTLYTMDETTARRILAHRFTAKDLLGRAGDLYVLAPNMGAYRQQLGFSRGFQRKELHPAQKPIPGPRERVEAE